MAKKSFFRERSIRQIQRMNVRHAYKPRGIVRTIDDLDPSQDALEIRVQIIPGRFKAGVKTWKEASRKCFKHGDVLALEHPKTLRDAYECPLIPLKMRAQAFSKLKGMKEEEIFYMGYSMQPGWGDKLKRIFPFVFMPEGLKIFGYAENLAGKINVECYDDANKVKREGASVVLEVPSRTKKSPRYKFKLLHVPIIRSPANLANVISIKPSLVTGEEGEPEHGTIPHDLYRIRYTWEKDREGSEVIMSYPHHEAGYLGIVRDEVREHNLVPMEMNPFALFSRHGAEFYKKLCNNVVIYDPTLREGQGGLRKLHLAEKSIILARAIGQFGHDDFAFWDPGRDGKLKDYDWNLRAE